MYDEIIFWFYIIINYQRIKLIYNNMLIIFINILKLFGI